VDDYTMGEADMEMELEAVGREYLSVCCGIIFLEMEGDNED
jgi:hypothetical protein